MGAKRALSCLLGVLMLALNACQNNQDLKPAQGASPPPVPPSVSSLQAICNHKDYCLTVADLKALRTVFERRQSEAEQKGTERSAEDKLRIGAVILSESYAELFQLDILVESTQFTLTLLNKMNEGSSL